MHNIFFTNPFKNISSIFHSVCLKVSLFRYIFVRIQKDIVKCPFISLQQNIILEQPEFEIFCPGYRTGWKLHCKSFKRLFKKKKKWKLWQTLFNFFFFSFFKRETVSFFSFFHFKHKKNMKSKKQIFKKASAKRKSRKEKKTAN